MENATREHLDEQVFAGIDWSWWHHAVCIVDAASRRVEELTVDHSRAGLTTIVDRLRRHGATRVGIERGDGPVVDELLRHGLAPKRVRQPGRPVRSNLQAKSVTSEYH